MNKWRWLVFYWFLYLLSTWPFLRMRSTFLIRLRIGEGILRWRGPQRRVVQVELRGNVRVFQSTARVVIGWDVQRTMVLVGRARSHTIGCFNRWLSDGLSNGRTFTIRVYSIIVLFVRNSAHLATSWAWGVPCFLWTSCFAIHLGFKFLDR